MANTNKYTSSQVPFFYQRQTLDIMLFVFIDTYKMLFPSVTIKEAAIAFMHRHQIAEDLLSLSSVMVAYERTNKDYLDAQKTEHRKPGRSGEQTKSA